MKFVPTKKFCFKACSLYYQLLYYQEIVEQLSLYYGSKVVKKNKQACTKDVDKNKYYISTPVYITFLRVFYVFFAIRGLVVVFIKSATDTREKRIYLGNEHWHKIASFMESTVLFW